MWHAPPLVCGRRPPPPDMLSFRAICLRGMAVCPEGARSVPDIIVMLWGGGAWRLAGQIRLPGIVGGWLGVLGAEVARREAAGGEAADSGATGEEIGSQQDRAEPWSLEPVGCVGHAVLTGQRRLLRSACQAACLHVVGAQSRQLTGSTSGEQCARTARQLGGRGALLRLVGTPGEHFVQN